MKKDWMIGLGVIAAILIALYFFRGELKFPANKAVVGGPIGGPNGNPNTGFGGAGYPR